MGGRVLLGQNKRSPCADLVGLQKLLVLALQRLHLRRHVRRHAGPLAGINLAPPHLIVQRLARAADLGRDRHDRSAAAGRFMLVVQHQTHCTLAHFRAKPVRCPAHIGSIF